MKKSGLADSPFFSMPKQVKRVPAPLSDQPISEKGQGKRIVNVKSSPSAKQPIDRDTTKPRNHETTVSRYHDTIIELIRKAVKDCGKEAATYRFSTDEKKALEWLELALAAHESHLLWCLDHPDDTCKIPHTPKFNALLKKYGLDRAPRL